MAKEPRSPLLVTPPMTASHAYIDKPDDKAPEGVSFKPDGKFKVTGVFTDLAMVGHIERAIREMASQKWGHVDWDEFQWPWKEHGEDAKEHLVGKITMTPKTKHKPNVVDAFKRPVPSDVKVRGGDIIKCAVTIYLYENTENVKVGKKVEQVVVKCASLQLGAVQIIEKRASGGYADAFSTEEGGFAADDAPARDAGGSEASGGGVDDDEF